MSDQRPVWLLDVDGVLNAWDGTRAVPEGFESVKCYGFQIKYHPGRIARIRKMHDDGLCEIRWLTTWGAMANAHLGPIGVPIDLVVLAEPPNGRADQREADGRWWKLSNLIAFRDENPDLPIVWTDDDIASDWEAREWLESEESGDILAVSPVSAVGLTDEALDEIEAFLRESARDPKP